MFGRCIYVVHLFALMAAFNVDCGDTGTDPAPDGVDSGTGPDVVDGGAGPDAGDSGAGPDGGIPQVPELKPVSREVAVRLGGYARRLMVRAVDHEPCPVAWAFVNWNCQERALALQWAIATADPSLAGDPPTMDEEELTQERIQQVADNPSFDVGCINLTGPMVAEQFFVHPVELGGQWFRASPRAGTAVRLHHHPHVQDDLGTAHPVRAGSLDAVGDGGSDRRVLQYPDRA